MGTRWKPALLLILVLVSVFHVAQSNGAKDSAHIQETNRKHSIVIRRSSGSGGGSSSGGGHGSSTAGGRGGSSENGGGAGSDSNPSVPGWTVPLVGAGGANYRNNGGGRHNHRNKGSRSSFSLPVTMAATLLGAALLANI